MRLSTEEIGQGGELIIFTAEELETIYSVEEEKYLEKMK